MKKLVLPAVLLLSACSTGQVDDNKTAECSQIMGRVIQAPNTQRNPGSDFLTQHRQQMNAEAAREHARQAKCLN
ncbi:MAG: hypothetical protein SOX43_08490 [Pelistega sp.]|nr:hypothetical protein [Pelistega sp.]